ncbi:GIY-YIG nuclease family protein [Candidatus Nomurabacteria bacterium]|nr:GIY-YIG nuclease family protein [Candidatus Nomurabacteria bacterium]
MRLYGASAEEAEVDNNMYYFYVLRFHKNKKLYYGFTNDLKRRIKEHRAGNSDFSSKNGIFDLIFYEAYISKEDAREAEKYFKTGHGREVLKNKLKNYFGGVA